MGQVQFCFIAIIVDMSVGQTRDDELAFGVNDSRPIGTANLARWPYILNSPIAKNNDPTFLRPSARTVDNRAPSVGLVDS